MVQSTVNVLLFSHIIYKMTFLYKNHMTSSLSPHQGRTVAEQVLRQPSGMSPEAHRAVVGVTAAPQKAEGCTKVLKCCIIFARARHGPVACR